MHISLFVLVNSPVKHDNIDIDGVKDTVLIYAIKNYAKYELLWFMCVCVCEWRSGKKGVGNQIKCVKSFM